MEWCGKIREIDYERLTTWRSITPTCIIFETLSSPTAWLIWLQRITRPTPLHKLPDVDKSKAEQQLQIQKRRVLIKRTHSNKRINARGSFRGPKSSANPEVSTFWSERKAHDAGKYRCQSVQPQFLRVASVCLPERCFPSFCVKMDLWIYRWGLCFPRNLQRLLRLFVLAKTFASTS